MTQQNEAGPTPSQEEADAVVPHFMKWKWIYIGAGAVALGFVTLNQSGQKESPFASRRVAIIMDGGSTMPLKHTVQRVVDQCKNVGRRPPTWEWNPLRWHERTLRCYYVNQQTNFPMEVDWRFKDIGNDASGTPFLLLNGITYEGTEYDGNAAAHLLFRVVPSMTEGYLP